MYVCVRAIRTHGRTHACAHACMYLCMYVCVCQHFQMSFPLKPLGRLKPNFIWSLLGTGERKLVQVTWSVAFSPRQLAIGMHLTGPGPGEWLSWRVTSKWFSSAETLLSPLLKMPKIVLLSSLNDSDSDSPCPYMIQILKNILLWNQRADDLET